MSDTAKHNGESIESVLSEGEIDLVGQLADFTSDYPGLNFDEVVNIVLPAGFGAGPHGERFRREAQEVFDRERAE